MHARILEHTRHRTATEAEQNNPLRFKMGCDKCNSGKCAMQGCSNYDEFYNQLLNCPKKTIEGTDECPSIRSCPNCREAIEHTDACNNMECRSCNKHFCFICLQPAGPSGSLTCNSRDHTVAPVQII